MNMNMNMKWKYIYKWIRRPYPLLHLIKYIHTETPNFMLKIDRDGLDTNMRGNLYMYGIDTKKNMETYFYMVMNGYRMFT